jgi:hypothetical protein
MKRVGFFGWGALAAIFLAPGMVAENVTLTSAGNTVYDGIYVSPYYATVNGVTNTPIVCDDFKDNSYLNTPYTATVTKFSNLSSSLGSTAWGPLTSPASTALTLYGEAAWLTEQILQQSNGSNGEIIDSFADWAVFDPTGVASYLTDNPVTGPGLTTEALCDGIFGSTAFNINTKVCTAGSGGLLAIAAANSSLSQFSNVVLLTPQNAGGGTCTAGSCSEQEFIEVVPEGGAAFAYLFLAAICCSGAIYTRSRRKNASLESA